MRFFACAEGGEEIRRLPPMAEATVVSLTWINLECSVGPIITLTPRRATIDRHDLSHGVPILVIDGSVNQSGCRWMDKERFQQEKEC